MWANYPRLTSYINSVINGNREKNLLWMKAFSFSIPKNLVISSSIARCFADSRFCVLCIKAIVGFHPQQKEHDCMHVERSDTRKIEKELRTIFGSINTCQKRNSCGEIVLQKNRSAMLVSLWGMALWPPWWSVYEIKHVVRSVVLILSQDCWLITLLH